MITFLKLIIAHFQVLQISMEFLLQMASYIIQISTPSNLGFS